MVDIWLQAKGKNEIKPILASIFRFVESQEKAATLNLVNNLHEQCVLEELLEHTKPLFPDNTDSLDYLLKTAFRYPPLKYGSRFGSTFEQSLFYGSLNLYTALAEVAYYRFVYMLGPEVPFRTSISSEFSSFSVSIKSKLGVFLDQPPFTEFESILTSPTSYAETQLLGFNMRQDGVEAFRYISARDKEKGKNIALFSPKAFHADSPSNLTGWLCHTSVNEVSFLSKRDKDSQLTMFTQDYFWINGKFPSPST
ncbi:RES domain protein [Legionella quinlivanii]|uniref:RES domain protein n=1 Tax=Legionella quinlivanii TaxID=45073 RepID=A0A0W0Y4P3_9GAMM|nr:RES family NAD+ phosphorylase [Legionella quinlivanii]KTD51913.1 RES domain protein [Legionella quinlivanii]SEF84653.1 RES domain-containing protein [Legionella quinlivanii DSM 21216]STY09624.1 RES domain [Legionella quinlivanii]